MNTIFSDTIYDYRVMNKIGLVDMVRRLNDFGLKISVFRLSQLECGSERPTEEEHLKIYEYYHICDAKIFF